MRFTPSAHRMLPCASLALALMGAGADVTAQSLGYRIVNLQPAGVAASQVWDVNNLGQVAGSFVDGDRQRGFVWQDGEYTFFDGLPGALSTTAFGLSETGLLVGNDIVESAPGSGVQFSRGWVSDGQNYIVIATPGGTSTELRGISPNGRWIAGHNLHQRAFLLDTVTGVELDPNEPSQTFIVPQGINGLGQHVGSSNIPGGRTGYIFDIATQIRTNLTLPGFPDASFRDISAAGVIAGWATGRNPANGALTTVGVIGTPQASSVFMVPGSESTVLQGTNDAGWVSGTYRSSATGPDIGFVAIPVPEPESWALFASGLLAAALWGARRSTSEAETHVID